MGGKSGAFTHPEQEPIIAEIETVAESAIKGVMKQRGHTDLSEAKDENVSWSDIENNTCLAVDGVLSVNEGEIEISQRATGDSLGAVSH